MAVAAIAIGHLGTARAGRARCPAPANGDRSASRACPCACPDDFRAEGRGISYFHACTCARTTTAALRGFALCQPLGFSNCG